MPQTAAPIKSAARLPGKAGGFVATGNSISKAVGDDAHWPLRGMDAR
jgi:hypothetical protein